MGLGDSVATWRGGGAPEALPVGDALRVSYAKSPLFLGLDATERWFESLVEWTLPETLLPTAWTPDQRVVAFSMEEQKVYGVQFQIERNDPDGIALLMNFARDICRCAPWWTMHALEERCIAEIQEQLEDGKLL